MRPDTSTSRHGFRLLAGADDLHGGVRFLIAAATASVLGMGAFTVLFVATVQSTGCFISCDDPRPYLGVPVSLLAAPLAGWALNAVAWSMWPAQARRVGLWRPAIVGAVPVLGLMAWVLGADGHLGWTATVVTLLAAVLVLSRRQVLDVLTSWEAAVDGMPSWLRNALIALVVVAAAGAAVMFALIGRCDAFGGRCPDPDVLALWEREAVQLSFVWTLVAGAVVIVLARRTYRWKAWLTVAGTATLVALVAGAA